MSYSNFSTHEESHGINNPSGSRAGIVETDNLPPIWDGQSDAKWTIELNSSSSAHTTIPKK